MRYSGNGKYLVTHFFKRPDHISDPLYVCCVIFNPTRFRSRWTRYADFVRMCEAQGDNVILYTVEIAFGDRDFVVTDPDNPRHLQLRTKSEVWLKENGLNLLMGRLPITAKYIAWIDADIAFVRSDWANETLHQLQHYDFVQMWSDAHDLGPDNQIIQHHRSFAYCYTHGIGGPPGTNGYYCEETKKGPHWHPGFAWAARRSALDAVGGLMDFCILGSADHHMAHALIGQVHLTLVKGLSGRYKALLLRWGHRAKALRFNIGYVAGSLLHYWHGPKVARRYKDRWQILVECGFDPDLDLKRDMFGLWQLSDRSHKLRDRLRAYSRARNEDSVDSAPEWSNTMMNK